MRGSESIPKEGAYVFGKRNPPRGYVCFRKVFVQERVVIDIHICRKVGSCSHKAASLYGIEHQQQRNGQQAYEKLTALREIHPSFFDISLVDREAKKKKKRKGSNGPKIKSKEKKKQKRMK